MDDLTVLFRTHHADHLVGTLLFQKIATEIQELRRTRSEAEANARVEGYREGAAGVVSQLRALSITVHTDPATGPLIEALRPFADFAEKVEAFVEQRAVDGGSPVLPTNHFRLADFKQAQAVLKSHT